MKTEDLSEKDKFIFRLTVEIYLKTGKPVSSGLIAGMGNVDISSATIRNIMAKWEEAGYLMQPHTSAGRVPTDMGLRFYVNNLLEEAFQDFNAVSYSLDDIQTKPFDFRSLLSKTSQMLSEYSNNMGFVISPRISRLDFKHARFIKIGADKILLILVTTSNLVVNEIVETSSYFTQTELDKASHFINQNFSGRTLEHVKEYLMEQMPKYRVKFEDTLEKTSLLIKAYFQQETDRSDIFMQGASKLLEKPELFSMERLQSLFRNFEEKSKLARLLSEFISLDRVKVLIGTEVDIPDISECSLILSHYGTESQVLGSLGILGPKRLPYKKIIPLVECVAKQLSQTFSYDQ
ncbi:MAG: heat-inducible transcriptional repressor HrcA [Candidatus Aminicenantes bacterium]